MWRVHHGVCTPYHCKHPSSSPLPSQDYPSYSVAQPNQLPPRAYFRPWPPENLALVHEFESLNPILDSKVLNLLPDLDTQYGRG